MGINLVVAVTDSDWFDMLRQQRNLTEVSFWAPSVVSFRALQPGELFLFKLHGPAQRDRRRRRVRLRERAAMVSGLGGFREANGARSAPEMSARIARYRRTDPADHLYAQRHLVECCFS